MKKTARMFSPAIGSLRKALFGVAAAAASAATLGLTVLAPVVVATGEPVAQALAAPRQLVPSPGDVVIVPPRVEASAAGAPHTDPISARAQYMRSIRPV